MEPSPKKPKQDPRNLTQNDAEVIRKLMAGLEKYMRLKNQAKAQVEQELKEVKDVVKDDHTLRIFVKRMVFLFL
jgi:hypothetical protein